MTNNQLRDYGQLLTFSLRLAKLGIISTQPPA